VTRGTSPRFSACWNAFHCLNLLSNFVSSGVRLGRSPAVPYSLRSGPSLSVLARSEKCQKWTSISSQSSSRRSNRHAFVLRQPKCGHWSCRRLRPIYCRDGPLRTHPDTTTQKAKLAPCRTTPAAVSRLFRRPARCRRANLAGTSRAHRSRPRSQPAV